MPVPNYNSKPDGKGGDSADVLGVGSIIQNLYDPTEPDGSINMKAAQMCLLFVSGRFSGSANTQLSAAASGKFARVTSVTLKNTGAVRVAVCDSPSAVFTDGYPLEINEAFGGDLAPGSVYLIPESGSFTVAVYGGKSSV